MIGGFFGAFIAVIVLLISDTNDLNDWWWVLWGFLIGVFVELCARIGGGEDLGDAVVGIVSCGFEGGDSSGSSGCSSGGDGGSGCGGGCGGGGD
jgi:hypothetical protein